MEQMKAAIRDMGIERSVVLTGNRNDPVNVYNGCDLTVLTSRREGTPNVLLESMACGVPVVATNVSDNALVVPDGEVGCIVPDGDDAALADCVLRLLRNPSLLRRLSVNARRWVSSEFSIEALVRKTREVYMLLLNRRRELRWS
jgi:glycosyltransferase involved in cell wall biosynthesis